MLDLPLHGFGFKTQGLLRGAKHLRSADSLAWSYDARFSRIRLPGCKHMYCNNCQKFALKWRANLLRRIADETPVEARPAAAH